MKTQKSVGYILVLFLTVVQIWFPAQAQADLSIDARTLKFSLRSSLLSNLVYQLDCMADLLFCSKEAYQDLWKARLNWSQEDERQLAAWKALFERYFEYQVHIERPELKNRPFRTGFYGIDIGKKIRIASLSANNLNEYRHNLELTMVSGDQRLALEVVAHFLPKFTPWWNRFGKVKVDRFIHSFARLAKKHGVLDFAEKVKTFYGADLPLPATLYFNVMFRPLWEDKHTAGEQIENHSVIEVLDDEDPNGPAGVVFHELFHYFFASMPATNYSALLTKFAAAPEVHSAASYALLNEVLATTIGNGLVQKYLIPPADFAKEFAKDKSFYNESNIDRVSKRLLSQMEDFLRTKRTINDDQFVSTYLRIVEESLGQSAMSPKNMLRNMGLISQGSELRSIRQQLDRLLKPSSVRSGSPIDNDDSREPFQRFPLLSGVLLVLTRDIEVVETWQSLLKSDPNKILKPLSKKYKAFAYAFARDPKSRIYVLVGESVESLSTLIEQFAVVDHDIQGLGPAIPYVTPTHE
jgi:hypothetical protein